MAGILVVLATAAGIGLYLLTRDRKYLRFAYQAFKYALIQVRLDLCAASPWFTDTRACNCARLRFALPAVPACDSTQGSF